MKGDLKKLIYGYEDVKDVNEGVSFVSKKRFFSRQLSGSFTSGAKNLSALGIVRLGRRVSNMLACTRSSAYASFSLTFGMLTLLLHFASDFFFHTSTAGDMTTIIIGVFFSLISIPLFFFEGPLSLALQNHTLTDYIFFEFFCIKRMRSDLHGRGFHPMVCVFLATCLALGAYFWSVKLLTAIVCALIIAYISFISPEFPLFSGILVLPLIPAIPRNGLILSLLAALMLLSFLRKVLFGKRKLFIEQYDVILILLLLTVLISGIFLGGFDSFRSSLVILCAGLGYFVTGSAVTNRRLAECMVNSIAFSSVTVSVMAIVQFSLSASELGFAEALSVGVSATLPTAADLAIFLTVCIFATLFLIRDKAGRTAVVLYVFLLLLQLTALVFSGSVMAAMTITLSFIVLAVTRRRKMLAAVLLLVLALPYALIFLSRIPEAREPLSLLFGCDTVERLGLWADSLKIIAHNFAFGVGIGSSSFSSALSEMGAESASSAGNIFLGMASEAGVIAPLMFILLILVRLRHRRVYYKYLTDSDVGSICDMTAVMAVSMLIFGTVEFVFSTPVFFYLFFCIFGLGSATLRISREDHDNRVRFYNDQRRHDSAEIDVDLR